MYVEAFAAKLKKARQDTGFTQREIAKELQISKSNVCINYEPEKEEVEFADCETCKHFIVVHYATDDKPASGLCDAYFTD